MRSTEELINVQLSQTRSSNHHEKRIWKFPHHSNNILLHFQPKSTDRVTQQIQSKLGNFSNVRELLEEPKRLIGLDAAAQSPAPPDLKKASSSSQHHRYKEPPPPSSSSGGGHSLSSNRHPPPPAPAPPHQHSPKLNGVPKPFTFSRPASKGLSKLDGTAVSVGAVFQQTFEEIVKQNFSQEWIQSLKNVWHKTYF